MFLKSCFAGLFNGDVQSSRVPAIQVSEVVSGTAELLQSSQPPLSLRVEWKSDHMKENLSVYEFHLRDDDMDAINQLKHGAKGFSHLDVRQLE